MVLKNEILFPLRYRTNEFYLPGVDALEGFATWLSISMGKHTRRLLNQAAVAARMYELPWITEIS
jgi:hypothetical protein